MSKRKAALYGSLFIGLMICSYVYYLYHSYIATAETIYQSNIYQPLPERKLENQSSVPKEALPVETQEEKEKPFSVLVMGVDQREHDKGRTDTLIILTVNPATNSILMANIPRDTRTEISGHGTVDKINHAYAFGGIPMAVETVENFLNIPVHYYVSVNMEGLVKIIDLLGEIEVENEMAFNDEGYSFEEGSLLLDGNKALVFSRMRYEDPRGDLGRNERQREVLKAIIRKGLEPSNLARLNEMLEMAGENVKTNITLDEMKHFIMRYKSSIQNIETLEINGKGEKINGIYYYLVDQNERDRVKSKFESYLNVAMGNK